MRVKDFAGWHQMKAGLDIAARAPYYREREVWWTAIGLNVGFEEDGKSEKYSRPVLVLRKFNPYFFYGAPLSTTAKSGWYYVEVTLEDAIRKALITQVRAFDARRLLDRIGIVSSDDYQMVCDRVGAIFTQK